VTDTVAEERIEQSCGGAVRRLHFVRHLRCGAAGRLLGRDDPPLPVDTDARLLREYLARLRVERVLCSPLRRARETLALIAPTHWPVAETRADLREVDFGEWEGRAVADLLQSGDRRIDAWARFDPDFAFPGGEALGDFLRRVQRIADECVDGAPGDLCVVAHGGVIRAMLCHLLDLPPERYLLFDVRPGGIASIACAPGGKGVLQGLSHGASALWAG